MTWWWRSRDQKSAKARGYRTSASEFLQVREGAPRKSGSSELGSVRLDGPLEQTSPHAIYRSQKCSLPPNPTNRVHGMRTEGSFSGTGKRIEWTQPRGRTVERPTIRRLAHARSSDARNRSPLERIRDDDDDENNSEDRPQAQPVNPPSQREFILQRHWHGANPPPKNLTESFDALHRRVGSDRTLGTNKVNPSLGSKTHRVFTPSFQQPLMSSEVTTTSTGIEGDASELASFPCTTAPTTVRRRTPILPSAGEKSIPPGYSGGIPAGTVFSGTIAKVEGAGRDVQLQRLSAPSAKQEVLIRRVESELMKGLKSDPDLYMLAVKFSNSCQEGTDFSSHNSATVTNTITPDPSRSSHGDLDTFLAASISTRFHEPSASIQNSQPQENDGNDSNLAIARPSDPAIASFDSKNTESLLVKHFRQFVLEITRGIWLAHLTSALDVKNFRCCISDDLSSFVVAQSDGAMIEFPLSLFVRSQRQTRDVQQKIEIQKAREALALAAAQFGLGARR